MDWFRCVLLDITPIFHQPKRKFIFLLSNVEKTNIGDLFAGLNRD